MSNMDFDMEIVDFVGDMVINNYFVYENLMNFVNVVENPARKYNVQNRIDPFEIYDDAEFTRRYRMSKEQVQSLYEMIDGQNTLEPQVPNFQLICINSTAIYVPFFQSVARASHF